VYDSVVLLPTSWMLQLDFQTQQRIFQYVEVKKVQRQAWRLQMVRPEKISYRRGDHIRTRRSMSRGRLPSDAAPDEGRYQTVFLDPYLLLQ
jgi:hypothetical protein